MIITTLMTSNEAAVILAKKISDLHGNCQRSLSQRIMTQLPSRAQLKRSLRTKEPGYKILQNLKRRK